MVIGELVGVLLPPAASIPRLYGSVPAAGSIQDGDKAPVYEEEEIYEWDGLPVPDSIG
ncbi:hypothetical protein ACUV84_006583 [Puccinellia chinampoensis]